jgi:hypothetical protein
VDAPLWWSSGRSSDRQADQWLREKYGFSGGQVQTANSLRGAALVQGSMFVQRMREHFPGVGVTETHPKAVWKALRMKSWDDFIKRFSLTVEIQAGPPGGAGLNKMRLRQSCEVGYANAEHHRSYGPFFIGALAPIQAWLREGD